MNGISAPVGDPRELPAPPACEDTASQTRICGRLGVGRLASSAVRRAVGCSRAARLRCFVTAARQTVRRWCRGGASGGAGAMVEDTEALVTEQRGE